MICKNNLKKEERKQHGLYLSWITSFSYFDSRTKLKTGVSTKLELVQGKVNNFFSTSVSLFDPGESKMNAQSK